MSETTLTRREQSQAILMCNPALSIVRCSANEVMVRLGSRSRISRRIQDDARRELLAPIVEHFAIPQPLTSLSAAYPSADTEDLDDLVGHLRVEQVLIGPDDAEATLLALGLGLGEPGGYAGRRVAIVGGGRFAAAIAAHLADAGIGQLTVLTDDEQACRRWDLGDSAAEVEVLAGHWEDGGFLADAFDGADAVVIPTETPNPSLYYAANAVALETQTPWHIAYVDGLELVLGPLFRPFETGCFNDFDTQEEAGRSLLIEHIFYKKHLLAAGLVERRLPRLVTDLGASVLAISILQQLAGRLSFLEGSLLRIDLERLEVIKEPVLRLPRCPACIQGVSDLRHPFL